MYLEMNGATAVRGTKVALVIGFLDCLHFYINHQIEQKTNIGSMMKKIGTEYYWNIGIE